MPEPDGPQWQDRLRQAVNEAADAIDPDDIVFTVHPNSPEEFEAESHDEFRIRMFHRGNYQAGADYFTDDFDEVQAMVSDISNWGTGTTMDGRWHPGPSLLPDPTTDYAISEQADYDQHIAETGGSSQGWDGRGNDGLVSYDGGRISSMRLSAFPSGPNHPDWDFNWPTDDDDFNYPGDDMNRRGPDYDQPDPFDRSDPEQARQAKAIEDMNELWDE